MLRTIARRVLPRPLRNAARNPRASAAWLWNEGRYRFGASRTLPLGEGFSARLHPASAATLDTFKADPDQRREFQGFLARCSPGMVFFDIGASHGLFTLAALQHGGSEALAVAVDPSAASNRLLRINLALNGVADRAQVVEAAIGAKDGQLAMLTTGPAGDHYLVGTDEPRPDARILSQYTLPTLAERTGLRPSHLKIDVEGFEGEALEGGERLLREARPWLFLELHCAMLRDRERSPEAILSRLASWGFDRIERDGQAITSAEAVERPISRLVFEPPSA